MTPCVCGHWHAAACRCGCTIYQPDDGTDGRADNSCYGRDSMAGLNAYHHTPEGADDL